MIHTLLNAGANINARNREGNTPLHFAAGNGHTEAIRILLDAGADIDAKNNYRQKPNL